MKKLMPIESCQQCKYIGKEVKAGINNAVLGVVKKGSFKTFCTHPSLPTQPTIFFSTKLDAAHHYKFPAFCPYLDDDEESDTGEMKDHV